MFSSQKQAFYYVTKVQVFMSPHTEAGDSAVFFMTNSAK